MRPAYCELFFFHTLFFWPDKNVAPEKNSCRSLLDGRVLESSLLAGRIGQICLTSCSLTALVVLALTSWNCRCWITNLPEENIGYQTVQGNRIDHFSAKRKNQNNFLSKRVRVDSIFISVLTVHSALFLQHRFQLICRGFTCGRLQVTRRRTRKTTGASHQ